MKEIKFWIQKDPAFDQVSIWGRAGECAVQPVNLEFKKVNAGEPISPTLSLPGLNAKEFLQALTDAIAEFGIVPSGHLPPREEIAAVKYHLEDMRALVFKKMKAEV